ncbi:hypothetical protein [Microbulbifer hydrolyticus]|uniref:Uncharacterized protein n=1 Tax=Microbulbifer hydrolyticus TaxID=48074 RepID=A0A6P1TBT1_9GAMM|nr:hypothetical protein [Microbulbifer hydrolyticus]MBB5210008.1 hypothetical protein [Microbulbifer hydrolyticus]QHQ39467.1 hypothetical protein GTQ55_11055 [Microbulbifer hydrolyticus]
MLSYPSGAYLRSTSRPSQPEWKIMNKWTLLAVSALFTASASNVLAYPKQIAFLNHLFAVVGSETVNAIEQYSYLPGFIDCEKKSVTVGGEKSWAGR